MNIIFFGTSAFAIPSLETILKSRHSLKLVVTRPDAKKGRHLKESAPVVKEWALKAGIPVFQPVKVSGPESIAHFKTFAPDIFVVIAYGRIFSKELLALPRFGAVNLHGSLLPKYRGAAPTNWAVINGDTETGVTVMKMNEKLDEGDIISQAKMPIMTDDTNSTVSEKLSAAGAGLLIKTIDDIEAGRAVYHIQVDSQSTAAPMLRKEDGAIDWSQSADSICNRVRGLIPWPTAYTTYEGKILKVLGARPAHGPSACGEASGEVIAVDKESGIIVRTGKGFVSVLEVQLEGKRPMDALAFTRGHRIEAGYVFGTHAGTK